MDTEVSVHDIEHNGKNYIVEWFHGLPGEGHISITEACDDPDDEDENHMHEIYDFEEKLW